VLGDLATPRSVAALFDHRESRDVILSYRILKACNRLRRSNSNLVFPEDLIVQDLESDVRIFLQMDRHADSHTGVATGGGEHPDAAGRAEQFLALVLRERTAQSYNRVFRRLALLYPPLEIFSVYLGTMSEDARVRANAVEYIDRALPSELRSLVLPLLPGAKSAVRDELADTRFSLPRMTPSESLAALLDSHDMWLRTCALYVVGARREQALRPHVAANLASSDARVHDIAAWAEAAFAGDHAS
jgi:AAA family ATP:ADP antiporter